MGEYIQKTGMYKMAVHRMIKKGELQARKSGGVWLCRTEASDIGGRSDG